jgi:hypothetical protein
MMPVSPADPGHDETRPIPGSAAAAELGCLCPVLVNGPGAASAGAASNSMLVAPDCALHSAPDV